MSKQQKVRPAAAAFRQRLRHLREQEKYAAGPNLLERLPGRVGGPGFLTTLPTIAEMRAKAQADADEWVARYYGRRRRASGAAVEAAVKAIYDEAEKTGAPAPNINELERAVRDRLVEQNLRATRGAIRPISRRPEFKSRRRPVGKRRT
jgi:hypothetical protein